MTMQMLAETGAGGEGLYISVAAIAALGVAIAAVIKAFKAGVQKGKEAQDNNVTLKKPVPTIQTREEPQWATKPDLQDHIGWTRDEFNRVWDQFGAEREIFNGDLNNMHERINAQSTAVAELMGGVEKIDQNVSRLLDIQLGKSNGPTKR
jgi:hypothetical protein